MRRPAVFLDRDGVLTAAPVVEGTPRPLRNVDEFELLAGVADACAELDRAGLPLIVVTNQPDIARGKVARADVDAFNAALRSQLPITAVVVCPHDDGDDCACRKPRPGMLVESAAALGLDLAASVMVGDRWRDIAAGRAAGTSTVFVDHGYAESARADVAADLTVPALLDAVAYILDRVSSSNSQS